MDGKLVYQNGELVKQKDTESYSVMLNRILEKGVKGKRMIVINDEAHHCYLPKKSKNHVRMPIHKRAAQFAPFAALAGYKEAIEEAQRKQEEKIAEIDAPVNIDDDI